LWAAEVKKVFPYMEQTYNFNSLWTQKYVCLKFTWDIKFCTKFLTQVNSDSKESG